MKINNSKYVDFLIDTGASICTIKQKVLNGNASIKTEKRTSIEGIAGKVKTLGTCYNIINFENQCTNYEFHVVEDSFPIPVDGIIGADLLKDLKSKLDLEKFLLYCKINNTTIVIPIHSHENTLSITIAPRCEETHWINTIHTTDQVYHPQEICKDVFIAGTIAKPIKGKMPFKILNTGNEAVKINWKEPKSTPASEHFILNYKNSEKSQTERIKKITAEIKLDTLNKEESHELISICKKYQDIFHLDGDKLTCTNIGTAGITLKTGVTPKYTKPYRLPHSQKQEVHKEIQKMLADNIIEPSTSAWNSPILIVPKKKDPVTGLQKFRMVIDYRKLNEQIEDDKFPLPNINDIFDMLGGASYFSCIDLSQGYYQVELDPQGRPCTAFSTENGHYQLTRLPMGLKISPSVFSRMMSIAMSGLTYSRCFVYLDDLIIFGRNLQQHNKNLIEVFQRLRDVNLKIHPGKCTFLRKEVLYLGHILSENGILPDPTKSEIMKNYPIPKNADEVRRFVAFANYYRKFIPEFATITIPLNRLLRKNVEFNFNKDCQKAFEIIKEILISPKVLQFPNFDKDFILRTDASGFALGAILSNFDDKPIAYASKTLNNAEKNYSTIEKELLAIVWSIKHFRPYLFGRHFKILTDHRPLVYLFSLNEPSSRLTKFRLQLEEYNFTVEYSPGKENCTADALSRITLKSQDLQALYIAVTTRSAAKNKEQNNNNEKQLITEDATEPTLQELLKPPDCGSQIIELKIVKNFEEDIEKIQGRDIIVGPNKVIAYIPRSNCLLWKWTNDSTTARSASYKAMLLRDVQKICGPLEIKKLYINKGELRKLSDGHSKNNKNVMNELNEYSTEVSTENNKINKINNMKKYINEMFKETNIIIHVIEKAKNIEDLAVRKLILNDYHILPTSGHAGINRMLKNIKKRYYWTGLQQDIITYIKHCTICQKNKHINRKKQPMEITTTAETSFEKIYMDLVGPLEETENGSKYILTIQDELTKFMEAIPLANKEANTVAKGLVEKFILKYGMPLKIASDQGTEFINDVLKRLCNLLKIEQMHSTAYHHESIGALENSHKVLGAYLRSYVTQQHSEWDTWLPYYVFSYNTSVHSSTKYTPYELVYGKKCNLPSNIGNKIDPVYNYDDYIIELKHKLQVAQKDTRETLIGNKQNRKNTYDRDYKTKNDRFEQGDLVLLKNENRKKLDPIYIGPFEVLDDKGVNCEIKYGNKKMIVHKNRLKPFSVYLINMNK